MSEHADHFDLDDEFLSEHEESQDFDRMIGGERPERRASSKQAAIKKGKAAWSKLEDVLAERKLEKELEEFYDVDSKKKNK